jgi:predicted amidohydrolase
VRPPVTIAVAQPRSASHDVAGNAARHAAAVGAADARLVVFPELSLTGYELDAAAIPPGDPRLAPIVAACAEAGSIALVGAPVAAGAGRTHIAMLAVDGSGARVVYRKVWLGGAEPGRFTPGAAPAVVELDGWRLGLAICKDSRVPQHAAETAALGIDVYVAGMVEPADDPVTPESRARRVAVEHRVHVAIASFAGPTGGGFAHTAGGSGIWSSDGTCLAHAGSDVGVIARATVASAVATASRSPPARISGDPSGGDTIPTV